MASEEHKKCADVIKNTHSSLRLLAREIGSEEAWVRHCEDLNTLQRYAENMKRLATNWWEKNCADSEKNASSRISWIIKICEEYFHKDIEKYRQREIDIAKTNNIPVENIVFSHPVNVLQVVDVGSCYNPFSNCEFMKVIPIDLCPANESVFKCDFLSVKIGQSLIVEEKTVSQLPENNFQAVIFSLLLEYLPSSSLRKECCRKAFQILKPEGILVIVTPDSKHVGANAKIMKNWRYTLSLMGFSRVRYEKLPYIHCMAFRKSVSKEVAMRWAHLYAEDYMVNELHIPQDFKESTDSPVSTHLVKNNYMPEDILDNFDQLPFSCL